MREDIAWAVHELAASLGLRPVHRKKRAMLDAIDCGPAFQVKFTPRMSVFRLARKAARLKTDGRAHDHRSVRAVDRKSTRLNSSHANISYAVFCLKKKRSTV